MAGLEEKLTADEKRTLQNLLKLPEEVTIYRNIPWCEHEWDYPTIDENCQALLSQCKDLPTMSLSDDVLETIQRSRQFPVPFPIQSVRLEQLKLKRPIDRLKKNIVSTYPIIHERVLLLMTRFLDYKREYGSSVEQKFYINMTLPQLIDRILKKRAITFYGPYDKYMLITGKRGRDGWELVGTEKEKPPLVLRNCLSYDEQKICSMVYVSGYTENINDGERQNKGVVNEDNIEPNAVIIGIIGPRFKRTFKMEYEDIIISEKQNCPENGYGTSEVQINEAKSMWRKMWTEFYQIPNYSWEVLKTELKTKSKNKCWLYLANFVRMPKSDEMFCNEVYYKRLCVTIECVLLEAEARAAAAGKFAFVNVIGAGLGKWRVSPHQEDVYVQSFLERISTLLHTGQLDHISDINFSYIKLSPPVLGLFDKEPGRKIFKRFNANPKHPKGGINMQLESREPSAKLSDEHQGKLLVMTYAWDGNAHPGNEFWIGMLAGSGDSAAACATQISELHNAYINPAVCAANTKIVGRNGLASLAEYCTDIMAMAQNKTGLQLQKFAWYKPDWALPTLSKESKDLLYQSKDTPTIKIQDDLNEVIKKSKAFPVDFPINTVRLEELKARRPIEKLKKNIVTTYPVVHERVVMLMAKFLAYKREHGSQIEKALYKDMSLAELIDRILKKRAVVFMGAYDNYKLLYGQQGADGWEAVGTPSEKAPLLLANCLSYDEMKLSSMVYVSGHTACINNGNRYNRGIVNETDVELDAVIIGIVGPRFERKHRMEYEDILITQQQNTVANGYGISDAARQKWRQMWADFYKVDSPTYESLPSPIPDKPSEQQRYTDRFVNISKSGIVFDNEVYYKRLSVTADSVLLEAQARGIEEGRDTFVNVIGAGLGVWQVSPHQTDVYILTFLERTRVLMKIGAISRVADVNFAYVRPSMGILELFTCTNGPDGTPASAKKLFLENKNHPRGGINVQLERREPSSKLTGEHDCKLLVMTYPWDGNAHPGNEFWIGSLDGSGDPAAAASTQVSELHNAHINNAVCGANARVVGQKGVHKLMEWLAPQRG